MTRLGLALALTASLFAPPAARAAGPDFLPADTLGFSHVKAAELWKSDAMAFWRKVVEKAGRAAVSSYDARVYPNVSSVKDFTVAFVPAERDAPGNSPVNVVVLVRTTKPIDLARAAKSLAPEFKRDGKLFVDEMKLDGMALLSPTTLATGPAKALRALMAGKTLPEGVFAKGRAATETAAVVVAMRPKQLPDDVLAELPAPAKTVVKAEEALATLTVGKGATMALSLVYADAEAAEAAEGVVRAELKKATAEFEKGRKEFLPALAPKPTPSGIFELPEAAVALMALGSLNQTIAQFNNPPIKRNGDTLTASVEVPEGESAAVVAAGGLGLGLLLPATQKVRVAAARMQSQNNLKQIALSFHNYESAYGFLPSQAWRGTQPAANAKPLLSWRVTILPFIEQDNLYRQFKLDEPWDSPNNKPLIAQMPKVYQHPLQKAPTDGKTLYQVFTGDAAPDKATTGQFLPPFARDRVTIVSISDGSSNTFMVAEAAEGVIWTKPEDLNCVPGQPLPKLGGLFPGGFNAALCDGSVRFVKQSIAERTLRCLIGAADGMVVNPDE